MPGYDDRVFINVPFDRRYKKLFDALVFAVHDCGFLAHCALESDEGSRVRLDKLYAIIAECRYGIHDLSRVTLDTRYRLLRFNMPLELGIFLGAKRYGNPPQRKKSGLILERDLYRFIAPTLPGGTSAPTITRLKLRFGQSETGYVPPAARALRSPVRDA
jgi:hypothetical protein